MLDELEIKELLDKVIMGYSEEGKGKEFDDIQAFMLAQTLTWVLGKGPSPQEYL